MRLLDALDGYLDGHFTAVDAYLTKVLQKKPLCGFHCDFGGIPWQTAINRLATARPYEEHELDYHYITFESCEPWIELYNRRKPTNVLFGDFEPHAALLEAIRPHGMGHTADKIGVFGHHPREDMDSMADVRYRYFNPRHFLPDRIRIADEDEYERGVPVLYPLLKVAERRGADVDLIGSLGLRGYGYRRMAEEWEERHKIVPYKPEQTVEAITLLFAHRFQNSNGIVEKLTTADTWNSEILSNFRQEALYRQLFDRRDDAVAYALHHKAEFDGLAIWPVRSAFQQMHPVVFELQRKHGRKYDSHIFLNLGGPDRPATQIKGSMRTALDMDWNEILERAWPADVARNWGGQTKSAGFVVHAQSARMIVKRIIEETTKATGKPVSIGEGETDRLLGIELPEK